MRQTVILQLQECLDSRELLAQWTARNIRARYQQSLLGWAWAILMPVAQAAIFTVIFTLFVPIETGAIPYVAFSYVAIVSWNFLSASLTDMSTSMVDNMGLVTKIYFPREVLPLAAMAARMMDFALASTLLVPLLFWFQIEINVKMLLYLPAIFVTQLLLITGLGLACSAVNVFFRDVRSLLILGLQLWMYLSPVIYPVESVPQAMRPYYSLNPMAGIIEAYRNVLLRERPPGAEFLVSVLFAFLFLGFGYWLFKRLESLFADIV